MTFASLFELLAERPGDVFAASAAYLSWSVRLAILLGTALVICRVFHKEAAKTKHRLLVIMLVGGGLVPFLAGLLPKLHVIPAPETPLASVTEIGQPNSQVSRPPSSDNASPPKPLPKTSPGHTPEAIGESKPFEWHYLTVVGWLVGATFIVFRCLLARVLLARLQQTALQPSSDQEDALQNACGQLGIRKSIALIVSKSRAIPLTWGTARPVILLPANAQDWTCEQLNAVMLHETAHVKRHDSLIHDFTTLVAALHWFNPMVWLVLRRMETLREEACDDLVLNQGVKPSDYAEWLVEITTKAQAHPMTHSAALAMAKPSRLTAGTEAILEPKPRSKSWVKWTLVSSFVLLTLALVILAATIASEPRMGKEVRVTLSLAEGQRRVTFSNGTLDREDHLEHCRYLQWRESWAKGVTLIEKDNKLALKFQNVGIAATSFAWNKVDLAFLEKNLIQRLASDPFSRFTTLPLSPISSAKENPNAGAIHYLEGGGKFQLLAHDVERKTVDIRFQFRDPVAPPRGETWPLLKDDEKIPEVTIHVPQEMLPILQACAGVSPQNARVRGLDSYTRLLGALAYDASQLTISPLLLDEEVLSILGWRPTSVPKPIPLCRNAIAIIVHPSNPIAFLNREQLINLSGHRGSMNSWEDVGAPNVGKVMVLRRGGNLSGVLGTLLGSEGAPHQLRGFDLVDSTKAMVETVANNRHALGHCLATELTNRVRAVPFAAGDEAIAPTQTAVEDDRYPYTVTYYLYVSNQANDESRAFADWLTTSKAASELIRANSFVPVRSPGS